ncbi:MAG: RNA degradosome polyphosphate kinase, partial [Hungatella sp.]
DRRVEIMFPVQDLALKQRVIHILQVQLEDNVKAHILQPDGSYEKIDKRGKVLVNAQEVFCEEAILAVQEELDKQDPVSKRIFVPIESHS